MMPTTVHRMTLTTTTMAMATANNEYNNEGGDYHDDDNSQPSRHHTGSRGRTHAAKSAPDSEAVAGHLPNPTISHKMSVAGPVPAQGVRRSPAQQGDAASHRALCTSTFIN